MGILQVLQCLAEHKVQCMPDPLNPGVDEIVHYLKHLHFMNRLTTPQKVSTLEESTPEVNHTSSMYQPQSCTCKII